MKAKTIVPKKGKLPEPPLQMQDSPQVLPEISQAELVEYVNAKLRFQIAQADYEKKRAGLVLQLLQFCKPEPGDISVRLEDGGDRLVVVDHNAE